jgi:PAB-dependent poly(A)-specific ribonuclease subunit 2
MKRCRYICAATTTGAVNILDSVTFKKIKTWIAYTSRVIDMDAQHDFIVACGISARAQPTYMSLQPEAFVNVFDLKNMISMPPIPFPAGGAFVRMHPRMSTTSIVASQHGQIQVVDLMNVNTNNIRQANLAQNEYLSTMEIAPSGEAVLLTDTSGQAHLWGSPSRIRFAEISNPVEFADPEETHPKLDWSVEM